VVLLFISLFIFSGEFVAQFKYTVLLMPNGPMKITGLPFDESLFKSEHSIDDEEVKVLLDFYWLLHKKILALRSTKKN
jgi:hypothetical protein